MEVQKGKAKKMRMITGLKKMVRAVPKTVTKKTRKRTARKIATKVRSNLRRIKVRVTKKQRVKTKKRGVGLKNSEPSKTR